MLVSSQLLIGFLSLDLDDLLEPRDLVWVKWRQCHLPIWEHIIYFSISCNEWVVKKQICGIKSGVFRGN